MILVHRNSYHEDPIGVVVSSKVNRWILNSLGTNSVIRFDVEDYSIVATSGGSHLYLIPYLRETLRKRRTKK